MTLIRYGLKRLLYRLFASEHAPNFLLKGTLLFQLWYGQWHRPTRDADLLGFGPDDVPTLVGIFRSICSIAVDDGIVFIPRATIDEALAIQRNKIAGSWYVFGNLSGQRFTKRGLEGDAVEADGRVRR